MADDKSMDARDAAEPIPVGTPLRDAAVDPKPWDFLPPTNAGQADPHGPLVVAPEIHASGPAGIRPGEVFVDDTDRQAAEETALAERILVQGETHEGAVSVTPVLPVRSALKADWVAWAVTQGMTEDEATELSKDALIERFGV